MATSRSGVRMRFENQEAVDGGRIMRA